MAYQDPGSGSAQDGGTGGTVDVAKEQAGRVGQTAASAGADVARTAKDQAGNVVGEAKQQARDLVGEARTQASDQASAQKGRAVQGLRTLGDELNQMAEQGGQSGLASEVARQVSSRSHDLAAYLDRHEPADLVDQIRSYARRRPVVFLGGALVAGLVAGRLTRGIVAAQKDDSPQGLTGGTTPALPAGTDVYGTAGTDAYGTAYTGAPGYAAPDYGTGTAAPDYAAPSPGTGPYSQPAYEQGGQQNYGQGSGQGFGDQGYGQPDYPPAQPPYPPANDPAYAEDNPPARGWTP